MRIALLSSGPLSRDGGGVQSAIAGLSNALADAGHELDVFGRRDAALADDIGDWGAARVHAGAALGPAAFGYARGNARRLRELAPDVVHQHGLWTHASLLGRGLGNRLISPHNMLDPWALGVGAARKRVALGLYERRNLERAGCLHALAPAEAAAIRSLGIDTPVCLIPNGIDVPRVADARALPDALAAAIDGAPYLLYLGRLHAIKNLPALLEAWGKLERGGGIRGSGPSDEPVHERAGARAPGDDHGDARGGETTAAGERRAWRLIIAGWGSADEERQLHAGIARHRLERAHFVGGVFGADKHTLYARATGFVLPSLGEGLPMAALEAMAHGAPTLISDACNLPRALELDAARALPTDAAGLADALGAFVAASPAERAALGERARALVATEFSWREIAARFVAVYRWLREGGAPPVDVRDGGARSRRPEPLASRLTCGC